MRFLRSMGAIHTDNTERQEGVTDRGDHKVKRNADIDRDKDGDGRAEYAPDAIEHPKPGASAGLALLTSFMPVGKKRPIISPS